ncbi:MAG: ABC transporter substrate-binding protein [Rhizobiales bacterium]|nr:ABC transporter substrate-binding protein [Hyphomicrobiales bacterium]
MKTRFFLMASISTIAAFASSGPALAQSQELIDAAKAEGQLTTIALPHSWCNYGEMISGFKAKYGLEVNELNPDAGSGDEIEAVKANKDNTGPQAPDVIDVGLSFGPSAKAEGLTQPYKVATWDTIPDDAKDPEGHWYGDYYGVLSFVVNTDLVKTVPQDWPDLLKPDYANAVALAGDPRASNQAVQAVYAAGLSRGGGDAATATEEGLNYFAELNKNGNLVPVIGKSAPLAQGSTPIIVAWDYNGLSWEKDLAGNPPVEIVVPKTGVVAGVYVQAISAYAPHPNAAKLWMEYLYSDEGQLTWLKGFCHPIRFNDLAKNGKIPQELLDALPPAAAYETAVFPTLDEQNASKAAITEQWDTVVGANVQ